VTTQHHEHAIGRSAIRVIVADDHPVFRAGLRAMVEDAGDLDFVGEACDGEEVLALCRATPPDVVLMDLRMPGTSGVAATATLTAELPDVRVVMLTMLEDDTSLVAALRAGARGYVLKGAAPEEILRAIRAAAAGQAILDIGLADRLVGLATGNNDHRPYPFPELSRRERDVLQLLAAGHSNTAIATRLALSEKTVRNNVSAILAKLRATDRPAAIIRAREAGIATQPNDAPHHR
jgi:DNA-binding NarL/FixJ family response regulator